MEGGYGRKKVAGAVSCVLLEWKERWERLADRALNTLLQALPPSSKLPAHSTKLLALSRYVLPVRRCFPLHLSTGKTTTDLFEILLDYLLLRAPDCCPNPPSMMIR